MIHRLILILITLISTHGYAQAAEGQGAPDDFTIEAATCRGGSLFWHLIAIQRLKGLSQTQIIEKKDLPDPSMISYIDKFFAVPEKEMFSYISTLHGQCMEGALKIPHEKAAQCYTKILHPYFVKVFGPNRGPKPLPMSIMKETETRYINCIKM